MSADRANLRRFFGFYDMTAVGADPNGLFAAFEHGAVFYLLEEGLIAFFMMLFNGTDSAEFEGQFRETFLICRFSKFLIHIGPFIVFASSSIFEVRYRIRNGTAMKGLEPDLCMFFFVLGGFQKVCSDLFVAFFLSHTCIISILIVSLGFTSKSSLKIFFRLRTF